MSFFGCEDSIINTTALIHDRIQIDDCFKFSNNGYPIQDFYLTKVAKRADGKFQTEIAEKVFTNYADRYAKDCAAQ